MIRVDSRIVQKGDTFVALRGISSDGHSYISKAIEKGATKIIAEEGNYEVETILVEDTRAYLTDYLEETYRDMLNDMILVGITGTNGKTTTAYLLYQALNLLGFPCSYIGTIGFYTDKKIKNIPNTTPDILEVYEMFEESYQLGRKIVIFEVSSQGLAYKRVDKIKFDYALFTNLTQDHLDYHKNMDNYALAKQQLFKQLKPNGKAIINADDNNKQYFILPENNNVFYGINDGDIKVTNYIMGNEGTIIKYQFNHELYETNTKLVGKYNIYNVLSSIALLIVLDIDIHKINRTIPKLDAPPGRMDKIIYHSNTIIIDYAHTADAISNIIETIKEVTYDNIYTVFGCTGDRDRTKRSLMTDIVLKNSKFAIITNDDPHEEDPNQIVDDMLKGLNYNNYDVCLNRGKAIEMGIKLLKENDILLILGKGHEEYMIIGREKIPFNDKEEVMKYINYIE